jgi:uncharacterized protein YjbI with pentapeptide repeats
LFYCTRQAFILAIKISQTCFCQADLTGAIFKDAVIEEANFSDAILVDTDPSSNVEDSPG